MHNISIETMMRKQEQPLDNSENISSANATKYKEVEIVIRLTPRVDGRLVVRWSDSLRRYRSPLPRICQ